VRADGVVRFQLVYTAEAHASDEWPVGSHIAQRQPRSTHERVCVARRRLAELGVNWPGTLVDTGREAFQEAFACWPLRWYFLDGHTVTHGRRVRRDPDRAVDQPATRTRHQRLESLCYPSVQA